MTFTCGCQPPTYCPTHRDWECHADLLTAKRIFWSAGECPVCFNARIRSVNLDSRATPTRNRE